MTEIQERINTEIDQPVELPTEAELWLDNVANHPSKLVTLLVLSNADGPLSKGQLYAEVKDHCVGEMPFSEGTLFAYRQTMLKSGGIRSVEATAIVSQHPRTVEGVEITEQGREKGAALSGLLLDWQMRNPDLPLQKLLGSSSNKVIGAVSAPTLRMLAFADMVEEHDNARAPYIDQLASVVASSDSTKHAMVDALAREGIVDYKSQKMENEKEFTIIDPTYRRAYRQPSFEKLKPETQLIYNALAVAKKVRDEWKIDEFLRLAEAIGSPVDPAVMKKVRTRLQHAFAPSSSGFESAIRTVPGKLYEGMTLVKLKQEHLAAVSELVTIFDGFAGGKPDVISKGKELARNLYNDPRALGWLMRYSYEVSSRTESDPAKQQRLIKIIEENPGLATKHIVERYRAVRGKRIGLQAVRNSLADEAKRPTPRLEIEHERVTPIKNTTKRTFHPKQKSPLHR